MAELPMVVTLRKGKGSRLPRRSDRSPDPLHPNLSCDRLPTGRLLAFAEPLTARFSDMDESL